MRTAAVGIATIPKNEDVASEVSEQLSQEVARLQLSDVVGVELKVEIQPLASGRRSRNGRAAGLESRPALNSYRVSSGRRYTGGWR